MRAVNLIPAEQRSGASVGVGRSQGGAYAVLLLIGGLAVMAFLYGRADHQAASRRAQAATVAAKAQQDQAAAERLAPYTSFIALREQRTQTVDTLVDSRFDWAHVLHEFGRVLPSQASISSLSGTIGSATSTATATAPASSSAASRHRGGLGDTARQRPDFHARRLRHQPAGCGADARAPAPDRRRQRSHASELHLLRRRRGRRWMPGP